MSNFIDRIFIQVQKLPFVALTRTRFQRARLRGVSVMNNFVAFILAILLLTSCVAKERKLELVSESLSELKVNDVFEKYPATQLDPYFIGGRVDIESCSELDMADCDFALLYWSNGCGRTVAVIESCKAELCSYEYEINNEVPFLCE